MQFDGMDSFLLVVFNRQDVQFDCMDSSLLVVLDRMCSLTVWILSCLLSWTGCAIGLYGFFPACCL